MIKTIVIKSKYGEFDLLIDEEDLDLIKKGLFISKDSSPSGYIRFAPRISRVNFIDGQPHCVYILIAERLLERPLKKGEVTHHIDGNVFNCTRKNLLVCTRSKHMFLHTQMSTLYMKEHFQESSNEKIRLLKQILECDIQNISGIYSII